MHVSAIVGPMGDERNGVQYKWAAYCKDAHIKSQIPTYNDNRFNALFETSAAVVTHHTDLVDFVTKISRSKQEPEGGFSTPRPAGCQRDGDRGRTGHHLHHDHGAIMGDGDRRIHSLRQSAQLHPTTTHEGSVLA